MSTVEIQDGEFKDIGEEVLPGGGLVLPEEVVADLAGQLVARARAGEPVRLTGAGGLLGGVIGQVLQAGLALELEEHLRRDGGLYPNGRNGFSSKTLKTEAGPVRVAVPRDRAGTFEPVLVPKGERRTSGISDTVVSLYAGVILSFRVSRGCDLRHRVADSVVDAMAAALSGCFQGAGSLPDRVRAERWSPSARASWRRSRAFSSASCWLRWRAAVSRACRDASVARWRAGMALAGSLSRELRSRWIWLRMSGWV
jgi:hypothetical protein